MFNNLVPANRLWRGRLFSLASFVKHLSIKLKLEESTEVQTIIGGRCFSYLNSFYNFTACSFKMGIGYAWMHGWKVTLERYPWWRRHQGHNNRENMVRTHTHTHSLSLKPERSFMLCFSFPENISPIPYPSTSLFVREHVLKARVYAYKPMPLCNCASKSCNHHFWEQIHKHLSLPFRPVNKGFLQFNENLGLWLII